MTVADVPADCNNPAAAAGVLLFTGVIHSLICWSKAVAAVSKKSHSAAEEAYTLDRPGLPQIVNGAARSGSAHSAQMAEAAIRRGCWALVGGALRLRARAPARPVGLPSNKKPAPDGETA